MEESCEDCTKVESCAGNDSGIFPCPDFTSKRCHLISVKVILASHDPGEPPSWIPPFPDVEVFWVNRVLLDQLKELRYKMPCNICPDEIRKKCEVYKEFEDKNTLSKV